MSTQAQRNAVQRALEIGRCGMTIADIQQILRRPRSLNLGPEHGDYSHHDELTDEQVAKILSDLEATGDARRENGLWFYRNSMAPSPN